MISGSSCAPELLHSFERLLIHTNIEEASNQTQTTHESELIAQKPHTHLIDKNARVLISDFRGEGIHNGLTVRSETGFFA